MISGYKTDKLELNVPSFGPETRCFPSIGRSFYGTEGALEGSFVVMTKNKPKMVIKWAKCEPSESRDEWELCNILLRDPI